MDQASKTRKIDAVIVRFRTEAERLREEADKKERMAETWDRLKRRLERREQLVSA